MKSSPSPKDLVIVANRLPVTVSRRKGRYDFKPSAGGLATALSGVRGGDWFWIGWPGCEVPEADREEVTAELLRDHRSVPVYLTKKQVQQYYNRFANGVIWPLFHYLPEFTDFDLSGWSRYREVNETFADAVAPLVNPEGTVWVHDYHLMLLPALLRERLPRARIGFFLHTPFPSSEVYRLLPVRRDILEGLLGADVLGFHSYHYARHFNNSCMRILGCDANPQHIEFRDRRARLSVNPIGIDSKKFEELRDEKQTERELVKLRREYEGRKVILGVDRLDYSKGLKDKMRAFGRFLELYPDWISNCVLLQIAVPSRTEVQRYRQLRREIEELVGHVNGLHGGVDYTPIQFLFQSVSQNTLSALYQLADVCWVSSLRDGMNLVSQEYLVSKKEPDGALVLSEFAGSAGVLDGALQVNPWHTEQMARTVNEALHMPAEERRRRVERMQRYIRTNSVGTWARNFIERIRRSTRLEAHQPPLRLDEHIDRLLAAWERAPRRTLLLDYDDALESMPSDGSTPSKAEDGLIGILGALAKHSETDVYVSSGHSPQTMETWLGKYPIGLCAEHGYWLRPARSKRWERLAEAATDWVEDVVPIMESFAATTPGARIERRGSAIAWHWRECEPGFGRWQANELALHLNEALANLPVEVLHGDRSVEVRPQGVHKELLSRRIRENRTDEDFLLAVGSDRADEDIFIQLPSSAWTCRLGRHATNAQYYVETWKDVVRLLRRILEHSSTRA